MEKRFSFKNIDKAPNEQKLIYYKIRLKSYKKRNSAFVNSLDDDVYEKHIAWYKETIKEIKEQIKEAEKYQPLEQPQDKKQNHEWLLMHELLEKQNNEN